MPSGVSRLPEFQGSRNEFESFPLNLLRTDLFHHELEAYRKRLDAEESAVFHFRHRSLFLLQCSDSTQGFSISAKGTDVDQLLQNSMNEHTKDPMCQYLFIHARDSRAQLSISKKQLMLVLTHLQAMPAFLDHIFTFRIRETPHLQATFAYDDNLTQSCATLAIDELGRSGFQLQHCFNLLGVEEDPTRSRFPWFIRQTAVHFSFDLVGGQASWVVLKSNGVIRERLVKDVDSSSTGRQPHDLSTPKGSFLLAMRTHLLLFEWCTENWSDYLKFLENRIEWPSALAKGTDVADLTGDAAIERRAEMHSPHHTRHNTGFSQHSQISRRSSSFYKFFGIPQRSSSNTAAQNAPAPDPATKPDPGNVEELFRFDRLQSLHRNMSRLEEASEVVRQDRNVMEDIVRRFEGLQNSADFSSRLKIDASDFDKFYRRARASIRYMDSQYARLRAVVSSLDKVISLFTAILQYSNMKTGEYFALHAKESTETMGVLTKNMHELAAKTKKETVSMHFITVLTLFFLPGTFVATFFSTGILEFGSEDSPAVSIPVGSSLGGWSFRPSALKLFLSICLPLMTFVGGLWVLAYIVARREQRKFSMGFEGAESASGSTEKGQGTASV